MKHSLKIIRKAGGGVEVKASFSFTPEEAEAMNRIPDDPHVNFSTLKQGGPEDESKIDFFLAYLRIIIHWVFIYNDPSRVGLIMDARGKREASLKRMKKRRRKR